MNPFFLLLLIDVSKNKRIALRFQIIDLKPFFTRDIFIIKSKMAKIKGGPRKIETGTLFLDRLLLENDHLKC